MASLSRRLHHCKDRVVQKKEPCVPLFGDSAGHPKIGCVHREGFQEIPGDERMGICPVRVRCGVRYLHTGRKRQFIWKETLPSVPYAREGKRLRLHSVSDEENRRARIGTLTRNCTRHVPELRIKGILGGARCRLSSDGQRQCGRADAVRTANVLAGAWWARLRG